MVNHLIIFTSHHNLGVFSMRLMTFVALSSLAMSGAVMAQPTTEQQYNMVSIQASASRQISNDQMQAILSIEKSQKSPQELANQVNQLMNLAATTAKKYPTVKFKTGQQQTYPIYDDNNRKLKEWRNESSVILESQDFEAISKLIADLQQQFQLKDVSFSVSEQQRKKVEDELFDEVSKNFQERANIIRKSWNKSGYELVNFSINTQNQFYPTPMMASARMSAKMDMAAAPVAQEMSAGESKITVNAHGNIQLK